MVANEKSGKVRGPSRESFYWDCEWGTRLSVIEGKVISKLHVITLSGSYGYSELVERLGKFVERPKTEKEYPMYDKKYLRQFKDFRVAFYVNPNRLYLPWSILKIFPLKDLPPSSHREVLADLAGRLPRCKLHSIEYTVDIHCEPRKKARTLFWSMLKWLYVPYAKRVRIMGGKMLRDGEENYVAYFGKGHKMYERGATRPSGGPSWSDKTIDRLRLEYTAPRGVLKKHKLSMLEDLVESPKFFKINSGQWRLKKFKAGKLPGICDAYPTGSFQGAYLEAKRRHVVQNPPQHLTNIDELSPVEYLIQESMSQFDKEWSEGRQRERKSRER